MPSSFKQWYAENGARLNAERRLKYQTDPAYREKVLEANAKSRESAKEATRPERRERRIELRKRRRESPWQTRYAEVNGERVEVLSIGALAAELGCSIAALRVWERKNILKKTPLRSGPDGTGDRLYTRAMVEEIRSSLQAQGRPFNDYPRAKPVKRFIRLENGQVIETTLYLIGVLAKEVQRNVATLEQLESRGVLPKTPFRTSSVGRRLYTQEMIEAVRAAFLDAEPDLRGDAAWQAFYNVILADWQELGIVGASLVEQKESEPDVRRRKIAS